MVMGSTEDIVFMPLPAWYRGVFSRMDIMELRDRNESRMVQVRHDLRIKGKWLLSRPVKRIEHFMVIPLRE